MAHFAQIDQNNLVTQVIVVANSELLDENGVESEAKGIAFCQSLFGADTAWVQTSYNGTFRGRYAGIGYTYDTSLNAFIAPKPEKYPSWVVDLVTTEWVPPIPRPIDTVYRWDESTVSWIVVPSPFPSWIAQGDPLMWVPPIPYPEDGKRYKWDESTISWVEVSQS